MSHALSVGARKAFLFFATGLTSAMVAASVRSFVVSGQAVMGEPFAVYEQVALSRPVALSEQPTISEQPAISGRRESFADTRQVLPAFDRSSSLVPESDMAVSTKAPSVIMKHEVETPYISYGRASYHGHKSRTAGGQNAKIGDFTAAHPTLPVGTRVRVTNLFTENSVMVRINDRGPIVRGRIVDVSYSAAEQLGIVGKSVAHVRLEVVE
jgi:rare lipoprotein A